MKPEGAVKRGTLRRRTYAVVLAVVALPLALVVVADRSGASETIHMAALVDRASTAVAAEIERGGDVSAAAEREAAAGGVRVLVIGTDGAPIARGDHEAAVSVRDAIGDVLFGPGGAPTLAAHDASRPTGGAGPEVSWPEASWPEIEAARRAGRSSGCEIGLSGTLTVCHAAIAARGGAVVLAQKSSSRAIRALFDLRYPLLKLTLYVLILGALLAAWLGRRLLAPVERLRREVLSRAADPLHAAPIPEVSRDEVGDLGDAFNALLAALAAKSRANEAFAADLAHELKSPIAALRACADGISGPVPADRAERIARVLADSTSRLDALVSRFLEIARAEAGLPNEERTVIDAAALVRGVCSSVAEDERFAGVRFEVAGAGAVIAGEAGEGASIAGEPGEGAAILGAAGPLEAALRNVVENGASFAGDGGWVRARVGCDAAEGVTIEIADSGPGIAPASLPRVFERFFTDRPDGKGKGTGLGLAYAKAVVEAHGGAIVAASRAGEGAVLTLRLPPVSRGFHAGSSDDSRGEQG